MAVTEYHFGEVDNNKIRGEGLSKLGKVRGGRVKEVFLSDNPVEGGWGRYLVLG